MLADLWSLLPRSTATPTIAATPRTISGKDPLPVNRSSWRTLLPVRTDGALGVSESLAAGLATGSALAGVATSDAMTASAMGFSRLMAVPFEATGRPVRDIGSLARAARFNRAMRVAAGQRPTPLEPASGGPEQIARSWEGM